MNLNDLEEYLKNKKIILFTVTKDTVNFLKLYRTYQPDFSISGIVDLTLSYRPNVKNIIDEERGDIPIYTSMNEFRKIANTIDIIVKFDHAIIEDRLMAEGEQYSSEKFHMEEFETKLKDRYEKYINIEHGSEFTFIVPPSYQSYLNSYLVFHFESKLMQCYGDMLLITYDKNSSVSEDEQLKMIDSKVLQFDYNAINFVNVDRSVNIYQLMRKDTPKIKPIFVISSDFAAGKTRYILSNGGKFLSGDLFTAFFDIDSYYGQGNVLTNEFVTSLIHKALARIEHYHGDEQPIYVKIEGCINSFLFDFEQNTTLRNSWSFFHRYFDDYEFHVIIKEDEEMERLKDKLNLFQTIHQVDPEKIKIIRSIRHCEEFEEVM